MMNLFQRSSRHPAKHDEAAGELNAGQEAGGLALVEYPHAVECRATRTLVRSTFQRRVE